VVLTFTETTQTSAMDAHTPDFFTHLGYGIPSAIDILLLHFNHSSEGFCILSLRHFLHASHANYNFCCVISFTHPRVFKFYLYTDQQHWMPLGLESVNKAVI